jgi:hypothetical protein
LDEVVTLEISNPLPEAVREEDIDLIHATIEDYECLRTAGLKKIGELVDGCWIRLEVWKLLGDKAGSRIHSLLSLLEPFVTVDGHVEWESYWMRRGVALVPRQPAVIMSAADLLRVIPEIVQQVIHGTTHKLSDAEKWCQIIKARRLSADRRPLEKVGSAFDLTRERVRQIEEKAMKKVGDVFEDLTFSGRAFRFRPAIVEAIRSFYSKLPTRDNATITEAQLFRAFELNERF